MTTTTVSHRPSKPLHVTLWILQALLSVPFIMGGLMKLATPIEELTAQMPWITPSLEWLIRFIGVSELLGAVGLIVPSLTRIRPFLTVWAAVGLAVIMVLAFFFHLSRNEYTALPVNVALGAIAVFIVWGRGKSARIQPR
jgi:putative oxidoreductase